MMHLLNTGTHTSFQVFLRLGEVEVADYLRVVEYLKGQFHYIDEKRIVMMGSNYGGLLALLALGKDLDNLFCCGIIISPILRLNQYSELL